MQKVSLGIGSTWKIFMEFFDYQKQSCKTIRLKLVFNTFFLIYRKKLEQYFYKVTFAEINQLPTL